MIRSNRYQPRKRYSEDDLKELSDSIKTQGIIQPLVVRRQDSGYELVAGERRLRAAKKAGKNLCIFLTHEGVLLTQDPKYQELADIWALMKPT